jgi:hypothetical protein
MGWVGLCCSFAGALCICEGKALELAIEDRCVRIMPSLFVHCGLCFDNITCVACDRYRRSLQDKYVNPTSH